MSGALLRAFSTLPKGLKDTDKYELINPLLGGVELTLGEFDIDTMDKFDLLSPLPGLELPQRELNIDTPDKFALLRRIPRKEVPPSERYLAAQRRPKAVPMLLTSDRRRADARPPRHTDRAKGELDISTMENLYVPLRRLPGKEHPQEEWDIDTIDKFALLSRTLLKEPFCSIPELELPRELKDIAILGKYALLRLPKGEISIHAMNRFARLCRLPNPSCVSLLARLPFPVNTSLCKYLTGEHFPGEHFPTIHYVYIYVGPDEKKHYVVSCLRNGKIVLYDSLHDEKRIKQVLRQLQCLYKIGNDTSHIEYLVPQSQGANAASGLFAVANATMLIQGIDPCTVTDPQLFRTYMDQCLQEDGAQVTSTRRTESPFLVCLFLFSALLLAIFWPVLAGKTLNKPIR